MKEHDLNNFKFWKLQPLIYVTKRKEVDISSKPCICIDVSENTSHVQGFINSIKTPVSKSFKIKHTITSFNKIKDLYNKLVTLTNLKTLIIITHNIKKEFV